MDLSINYLLTIISLLFFWIAYYVGIKKQTWILAGFNEARIRERIDWQELQAAFS